ncbi:hypothetical protein DEI92_04540 [Curtobacterium sp. MCBD17_034]|uniref:helix-turn-helix domain-containing protein n=1 Tax=unclassified Curtobacterium TaxID=257496 RepID=UPI000DA929AF|nr:MULTISPECIES: AraC family transcriptional regulator [unclassified Curtobacterium]PZE75729.1 hypothetical protein DEI82_07425 [Curtobacterium sp. MCBD17_019]PZF60909.1 hypothetical protein DEI92_04540 [Curtobacterium sp. MCBD17_034]PZM40258.1 hypothetical protein DEI90_00775 [Curtobacterium sp. MCBD17_031]WIB64922.1 AraC family transcriptional regulator [Curtobacterium sp. MCBD17_040]WIB68760.1 AraC family transcriptional regulator [Curtobacterium sp. MCBD17_035]
MRNVFFSSGRSVRVDTDSADRALVALRDAFDVERVEVADGPFRFRQEVTGQGRFAVARVRVQGRLVMESQPLPFWSVIALDAGRVEVSTAAGTLVRSDATPLLFPRDGRKRVVWEDAEFRQIVLREEDARREFDTMGLPPGALRVHDAPDGEVARLHWQAVADHVRQVTASGMLVDSPIVRAATFHVLVAAFVEAFVDRQATPVPVDPGAGSPIGVRRALQFIQAHAAEELSVDEIAASAGMSPRGLQAAFLRQLGHSPMTALRRERLRRAHEALLLARDGSGTTVAAVAAHWRFSNPGRFATQYLREYGRSPRETLRAD